MPAGPGWPVLIVTGAAGAGKSTLGSALAADPRLLVLDGDVLAGGAAAVADGARDYHGFWRYLLAIGGQAHRNGLVPVFACICLPEQVLGAGPVGPVHFLALVSDADTVRCRIVQRLDGRPTIDVGFHQSFDKTLSGCSIHPPHTLTFFNTVGRSPADTVRAGRDWAGDTLGKFAPA
ncbi:MAG TPA: hypothetical protein VJ851_03440 [Jatrophihabitans sp.]|nr:hypothetical protein [Jatrophihabitans sp.]